MQQQCNYALQSAAGQKMFLHLPREKSVVFGMKSKYLLQETKIKMSCLDSEMLLHGALSHLAFKLLFLPWDPCWHPFCKTGQLFWQLEWANPDSQTAITHDKSVPLMSYTTADLPCYNEPEHADHECSGFKASTVGPVAFHLLSPNHHFLWKWDIFYGKASMKSKKLPIEKCLQWETLRRRPKFKRYRRINN